MSEPALLHTANGAVPIAAVTGTVLPREHLRVDLRWPIGADSDPGRWLDEEQTVTGELRALRQYDDLGLVVELSCIGMGRDAAALARVSAGSRVAVVAATGFATGPFVTAREADVETLTRHLLTEIDEGLDGTSIRPGVIGEIGAWGEEPTPLEERCLVAAARAATVSGLPIAVRGGNGLALLEILRAEGVAGHRVGVGPPAREGLADLSVHRKLAEAGAYVSFASTCGDRLRQVLDLIEAGHADRVLLSSGLHRISQVERYGGAGYGHLFGVFLPRLRAAGVTDDTIRLITHDNPLRWLAPVS